MAPRLESPRPLTTVPHAHPTPGAPGGSASFPGPSGVCEAIHARTQMDALAELLGSAGGFGAASGGPGAGPSGAPNPAAGPAPSPAPGAVPGAVPGGWPRGLVEVGGRGRSALALLAARSLQQATSPGVTTTAWIDGSGSFCPATAGLDLDTLTLVRLPAGGSPRSSALFAADVLLRCRAYALVVLDLAGSGGSSGAWFRLGRLAERSRALLLLLHEHPRPLAGSAAALALAVALSPRSGAPWGDLPPPGVTVSVLRHRKHPEREGRQLLLLPQAESSLAR